MTYTFKQLQRVHVHVHELAKVPTDDPKLASAHVQRIEVMDRIMASMFVYEKRTMDRDELDPNVVTLIDALLRVTT